MKLGESWCHYFKCHNITAISVSSKGYSNSYFKRKYTSGHISDIFYIAEGNFSKGLGSNLLFLEH